MCSSEENRKEYQCWQVTYKTTVRSPETEFEELVTAVKANNKRELMRLIDELHAKGMLSANERN